MPRNDALQGALPLLVLTLLARRGPLHGYAIATQIEALHDVLRVEEGSLYPALHRMEESGWVRARWGKTETERRARRSASPAAGRRQRGAEERRGGAIPAAIGHVLKHA